MTDPIQRPVSEDKFFGSPLLTKPRSASDPKQVEQSAKREQLVKDHARTDMEEQLSTPVGRRFLLRLLEQCGIYQVSQASEQRSRDLADGRREVGLWLISQIIEADPRAYSALLAQRAEDVERMLAADMAIRQSV